MSLIFGVFYVKANDRHAELSKRFSRVDDVGPGWVACGFGGNNTPGEAFDERRGDPSVCASSKLSGCFGEAIYLYADSRDDELLYDHSRDGRLIRKLMWIYDGNESSWLCAAGDPEPWEGALFSDDLLQRTLRYVDPEDHPAVRSAYGDRVIRSGTRWPTGGAWMADVIERHFGIERPPPKK